VDAPDAGVPLAAPPLPVPAPLALPVVDEAPVEEPEGYGI
jgi:hypothetical protein